jgi:prephenate dehydrogenase
MNIGIVGLGLIGGTYAKALKQYNYTIYGIDVDSETIDYALKNNIVDFATTNPKEYLKELDVVFLCLYPQATISFINKYMMSFKKGAIISDVVGVKRYIIDNIDFNYNEDIEFVFSHPVAGREKIGIKYSDKDIFQDSNFVITPIEKNSEKALNLIETLAKQMGFKNVSRISDKEHDEIIAYTSQLTHAIAISLVNSDHFSGNTGLFIGDSYKDLTRIAMINEDLWSELFIKNKDFLLQKINNFEEELDILKNALNKKDKEKLKELMVNSTNKRRSIND